MWQKRCGELSDAILSEKCIEEKHLAWRSKKATYSTARNFKTVEGCCIKHVKGVFGDAEEVNGRVLDPDWDSFDLNTPDFK